MPTHVYLTKVSFIEDKGEIICYFQDGTEKIAKRFSFKPFFVLNKSIPKDELEQLLVDFKIKNFIIKKIMDKNYIFSNSVSNLILINNIIAKVTQKKHVVLSPERMFLIEKNWSYFDSFQINDFEIIKVDLKKDIASILFLFDFDEALSLNTPQTISLIRKSALSYLLKIPIGSVSDKTNEIIESFFENIYFKNGEIISWDNEQSFFSSREFVPFGYFDKISKIDFSSVWSQILQDFFYNVGPDTINCNCCKPIKLDDFNLLPSTLIEVNISEDFFYYNSISKTFAWNFHKTNNYVQERLQKKKEFFLKQYPIGPLFKNQKIKLPLEDVKKLLDEKKVSLLKNHSLFWFCKKQESFISKNIKELNLELVDLRKYINQNNSLIQKKDFSFLFYFEFYNILNLILNNCVFHLTSPFSKFFLLSLANSISEIQESTLNKFCEFSESLGYRVLHLDKKNVFVKGYSALSLTKSFSLATKLPQPMVASFAKHSKLA